jgi:hypothetical protein
MKPALHPRLSRPMLQRRLKETAPRKGARRLACPSYEDLRIQSALLGYVLGEGHHEETIFELARRFSTDGEGDAVERAVCDLVGGRLLSIDAGKVVPGPASVAGRSAP